MDKHSPAAELAAAYREQASRDEALGATHGPLMGYKIALSGKAAQHALGLDAPVLAPIHSNSIASSGSTLDTAWADPLLECELGLRLLNSNGQLLVSAVPAFEVVAGPVPADGLEFIRSQAAFGAAVFGPTPIPVPNSALERLEGRIYTGDELLHRASFDSSLGGPLDALAWLSESLHSQSRPLMAGMLVLSGAAGHGIAMEPHIEYRGAVFDNDELVGEVFTRWVPQK